MNISRRLLTSHVGYGFLEVPEISVRRSNRLSCLPKTGKSIAAYSAVEVAAISGLLSHIGRVQRLVSVRTSGFTESRGALSLPFFVTQNLCEASMFRIYTTSRFLRFRLRLMSQLSNLAGHTAATVALGALLLLPVLFFGEVL